jgi:hypothetical protein
MRAIIAWRECTANAWSEAMIQASAAGTYAQVQGLFDHGASS